MEFEQAGLGFGQLLGVLRRRAPWILLCFVLFAGAAYGYSKHKVKKYTAAAELTFDPSELGQQIAGLPNSSNDNPLAQLASDRELVKNSNVGTATARALGHGVTAEEVYESLSIGGPAESVIVGISSTSTSPVLAAAIANTYARQFVRSQETTRRQFFKSALALVKRQLAELSPAQRFGSDGLDLEQRAHTLGLLATLDDNSVQVAQEATVPSSPSSPKTKRNTILGAVLGLVLGLIIAFLFERFDRRIRRPEELEAIYRLPLLGSVPKSAALSRSAGLDVGNGAVLPPTEAEVFSLIRAHLRFFNVNHDQSTVLIASPAPNDGKTTIARHLAEAAARSGSRVLLLEADLRQPTLAVQLGLQPGPGLAGVLIGDVSMDQATHSVVLEVPTSQGTAGHTLDVLVAGAVLPPNPSELLESRAMDALLERAKSAYDLVVIDTPPLTAVSDAFPLLVKVDGVVIVGRVGHSRRDAAEQLHQVLASSSAPLLGIIANESKSGGPIPYPGGGGSGAGVSSANRTSSSQEFAPTAGA
jgi:succinoglycan biosynthesis transport protein ExoP